MKTDTPSGTQDWEEKIKVMFDAVFEPRDEFLQLSKASQDLLLGELQDTIVEGGNLLQDEMAKARADERQKVLEYLFGMVSCSIPEVLCSRHHTHDIRKCIQSLQTPPSQEDK